MESIEVKPNSLEFSEGFGTPDSMVLPKGWKFKMMPRNPLGRSDIVSFYSLYFWNEIGWQLEIAAKPKTINPDLSSFWKFFCCCWKFAHSEMTSEKTKTKPKIVEGKRR